MEGGRIGNDQLAGDVLQGDFAHSHVTFAMHGQDFLDGGEGGDILDEKEMCVDMGGAQAVSAACSCGKAAKSLHSGCGMRARRRKRVAQAGGAKSHPPPAEVAHGLDLSRDRWPKTGSHQRFPKKG